MPIGVTVLSGVSGEATLVTERDSSSVLRVPAGAHVQCQHASAFDGNDGNDGKRARGNIREGRVVSKRLSDYTIVLDVKFDVAQLDAPLALVPLGHMVLRNSRE
jgi:hypothetical protein